MQSCVRGRRKGRALAEKKRKLETFLAFPDHLTEEKKPPCLIAGKRGGSMGKKKEREGLSSTIVARCGEKREERLGIYRVRRRRKRVQVSDKRKGRCLDYGSYRGGRKKGRESSGQILSFRAKGGEKKGEVGFGQKKKRCWAAGRRRRKRKGEKRKHVLTIRQPRKKRGEKKGERSAERDFPPVSFDRKKKKTAPKSGGGGGGGGGEKRYAGGKR